DLSSSSPVVTSNSFDIRCAPKREKARRALTARYRTIDSDGHVTEPPDLWQEYTDPAFCEDAPRFVTEPDGTERLFVEDTVRVWPTGFGGATAWGERPSGGYLAGCKGGFDPHARIPDMDADDIDAAFLFPSMALQFISFVKDPPLAGAIC